MVIARSLSLSLALMESALLFFQADNGIRTTIHPFSSENNVHLREQLNLWPMMIQLNSGSYGNALSTLGPGFSDAGNHKKFCEIA